MTTTSQRLPSSHISSLTEGIMPTAQGFLDLPAELRNHIYEVAIATHDGRKQPSIVNVCRQTRKDALSVFYSTHRFHFNLNSEGRLAMNAWLRATGQAKLSLIRQLRLEIRVDAIPEHLRGNPLMSADIDVNIGFTESWERTFTARALGIRDNRRTAWVLQHALSFMIQGDYDYHGGMVKMMMRIARVLKDWGKYTFAVGRQNGVIGMVEILLFRPSHLAR